ncbi:MAG: zf-HC2 domain-containing protein [bacterium]|nr:zf-HC2 domain-containing protein [bacterium]
MSIKKHVRELLSVYLDQMCSDEEKKIVETHLAECPECRQELADLRKTITLVAGLKEINPPANMWAGIEQRIQKKSFWEIFDWRPVPVAVATVAIFLMAIAINKYTVKVAEQGKTGAKHDITAGSSLPLTSPLLTPKPDQKLEEMPPAVKAKASPVPEAESVRNNVPVMEIESVPVSRPQYATGMTAISSQKGQVAESSVPLPATFMGPTLFQNLAKKIVAEKDKASPAQAVDALRSDETITVADDGSVYVNAPQFADIDTSGSPSYEIVMEVEDMAQTMQRLQTVAENYQARQVGQSGNNQELSYRVHQQEFPNFISDINKLGRDPRRKDASTGMRETIAANRFGARPTNEPQLIRIKFNPSR